MDGVLLLSSPIHAAAYRNVLKDFQVENFDYSRFAGMRTIDCLRIVFRENGIPCSEDQVRALAAQKTVYSLHRLAAENPIAPGCLQTLAALAGRHRLALASSASPATVELFLQRNDVRGYFHSVLHGGDVQQSKPAPEIYTLSCQRLGCLPAECLVVEDALAGIRAARAAGARTCGLAGTHSRQELRDAGADMVIERLEELLKL